jgi:hypothetical protein
MTDQLPNSKSAMEDIVTFLDGFFDKIHSGELVFDDEKASKKQCFDQYTNQYTSLDFVFAKYMALYRSARNLHRSLSVNELGIEDPRTSQMLITILAAVENAYSFNCIHEGEATFAKIGRLEDEVRNLREELKASEADRLKLAQDFASVTKERDGWKKRAEDCESAKFGVRGGSVGQGDVGT